jgi:hydroxymethylpyrimidine pyrophosphatase-like HAD family hydrolase
MFFTALATDYDGTIATDGVTPPETVEALKRFKATGRRLILVTGRELPDLQRVFPELEVFDRVVAENGGLLYEPATRRSRPLGPSPSPDFIAALKGHDISPLSIGEVIVATWEPNQTVVLDTIRQLGLELQIIFNKGAVMILPPNINKASGLLVALEELGLSPINVVGVGDAENDHAFLNLCGCGAAVANALPNLKEHADLVMELPRGQGTAELMARICRDDGAAVPAERHGIALGLSKDQHSVMLPSLAGNVLIAGQSGVGKSTIATALTERMAEKGLQFLVIDPEGDFEKLESATQLGNSETRPSFDQMADMLRKSGNNLVINALAVPLEERPKFFSEILSAVAGMRRELGRPHWLIVDEAHHVLPAAMENIGESLPHDLFGSLFITVHPDSIAKEVLIKVQTVIAVGPEAVKELDVFCRQAGATLPQAIAPCSAREVLLWDREENRAPLCLTPTAPAQIHRRHTRKYAEGELGPDKSFYFRGPDRKLNLRAQNLLTFLAMADGVDYDTWAFHRRKHDYSSWFAEAIKDRDLASAARAIEDSQADDAQARQQLRDEIERRYTAPAKSKD